MVAFAFDNDRFVLNKWMQSMVLVAQSPISPIFLLLYEFQEYTKALDKQKKQKKENHVEDKLALLVLVIIHIHRFLFEEATKQCSHFWFGIRLLRLLRCWLHNSNPRCQLLRFFLASHSGYLCLVGFLL